MHANRCFSNRSTQHQFECDWELTSTIMLSPLHQPSRHLSATTIERPPTVVSIILSFAQCFVDPPINMSRLSHVGHLHRTISRPAIIAANIGNPSIIRKSFHPSRNPSIPQSVGHQQDKIAFYIKSYEQNIAFLQSTSLSSTSFTISLIG